MKKIIIYISIIACQLISVMYAQSSMFSIMYDGGLDQCWSNAVVEMDQDYWTVSRGYISGEGGYRLSFTQVSKYGEILGSWNSDVFPNIIHMDKTNDLVKKGQKFFGLGDGNSFWILWSFDTDTKVFNIEYRDNNELLIGTHIISSLNSYNEEEEFVVGAFYVNSSIVHPAILDYRNGEMTKREIKGAKEDVIVKEYLKMVHNHLLMIGYRRTYPQSDVEKGELVIQQLDEQDSVIWQYIPNLSLIGVGDALMIDDRRVVISSREYKTTDDDEGYRPIVICVNMKTSELEWKSYISPEIFTRRSIDWNRMLMSADSSGIILGGTQADSIVDHEQFRLGGAIAKISFEGDSIWYRSHRLLDGNDELLDMEHSSDGGFIMSGATIHRFYPGPDVTWVNTWMLKIDGEGRLIPDTISTVTYQHEDESYHLRVYPNPANDHVYIEHDSEYRYQYSLSDQQGKVLKEWEDHQGGGSPSYILNTYNYTSGIYLLSVMLDGEVIGVSKLVVE